MEVSNTIMQLCAFREMFLNEIAQIDMDIRLLGQLSERYPGDSATNDPSLSRRHHGHSSLRSQKSSGNQKSNAAFSKPQHQLKALRNEKAKSLEEVQRQLELFQLHNASGEKLIKKLSRQYGSGGENLSQGSALAIPVVESPYTVTLTSDIAAS
jgi:hypothetical protein